MTASGQWRQSAWMWGVLALAAVGAALRIAGVFDDFWLDEIWSWRIARGMHRAADVLMSPEARVDNNHPLNTLLMYWMGDRAYWPIYRFPALVAGIAAVGLATWHMAKRYNPPEAVATAVLMGMSYPLVVYSSESRGYGLMVFFAVAAFAALDRFLTMRSRASAVLFSAMAVLGFLSHLTFAHFYAAALVWSAFRLSRESISWRTAAIDFAKCHVVPIVFALGMYLGFARRMTIGGAPDTSLGEVVRDALSVMAGGPEGSWIACAAAAVLLAVSLAVVWRYRRREFSFYLVCVVVAPAAFVAMQAFLMRGMETLFPRYFLVSMVFGYLLAATAFGVAWRSRWRGLAVTLLALYAFASLWQVGQFLRGTRGHYLDAAEYMAAHSPQGAASIGGDNAFRTQMLLGFYQRYLPAGKTLTYASAGTPDWFIVNAPQAGVRPGGLTVEGTPYAFEREFGYRGLSGWSWYLFRRTGR